MRILPQAPNLDFLKQQAKDVLAALRETDPGASLSDAQRALAQQYGFRAWTDLKVEVERARNKPKIFDAAVAEGIAKVFDLGDVTEDALLIETSVGGPSLRLVTATGRYRPHSMINAAQEDAAEESVRLMDAVREAGIKTARAIRSINGKLLEDVGDHRWRVDTWIDVGPTIAAPVSSEIAFKAGALLAAMHDLQLKPSGGMRPWLSARPRTADQWNTIVETVVSAGAPWAQALAETVPTLLDVSERWVEAPTAALVLAHTDYQPPSTHVDQDGALVPMGWEFAGAISPAWHIGMVLDSWATSPEGDIHEPAAKGIVEGYASVRALPELDVSIFSPVITAWLNWLVSRMNHALQGGEFEARELLHMLAHPKDRMRFERLLHAAGVR